MAMSRIAVALGIGACVLLPAAAAAQDYPNPPTTPTSGTVQPNSFTQDPGDPADPGTEVGGVQFGRALPTTGQDIAVLVLVGGGAVLGGAVLVRRARRVAAA